jgi:hypothetical protein
MKDKTLETKGSEKEKASKIARVAKERLGSTLQTTKDKTYKIANFVKQKAFETTKLPSNL